MGGKKLKPSPRYKCIVDGCKTRCPGGLKGMCWGHYNRAQKFGDPLAGPPIIVMGAKAEYIEKIAQTEDLPDSCIFWPFASKEDRGSVWYRGRTTTPAQAMCIRINGPMPHPTWGALHSCGNGHRGCINPRHISWGSRSKNFSDAIGHGTAAVGDRHPNSKITAQQALEIRKYRGPKRQKELAEEYGVSGSTIHDIQIFRSWKFLREGEDGRAVLGA